MNKMNNPELEVVRFGAEDVIATSGVPCDVYSPVFQQIGYKPNHFYLGSEYENGWYTNSVDNGAAKPVGFESTLIPQGNTIPKSESGNQDGWYHLGEGGAWVWCDEQYHIINSTN